MPDPESRVPGEQYGHLFWLPFIAGGFAFLAWLIWSLWPEA